MSVAGNLNRSSMSEISGARGPALVLRSVFAELHRSRETASLYRAPTLVHRAVCPTSGKLARENCPRVEEIFRAGSEPIVPCNHPHGQPLEQREEPTTTNAIRVTMPTSGINFARDPRIPDHLEAVPFEVEAPVGTQEIRWIVDDKEVGVSQGPSRKYLWSLVPGHHTVQAVVTAQSGAPPVTTEPIGFWVR